MSYVSPEETAFGVGFLERLEANALPTSFTQGPDPLDVLDSIKRNVARILNTRVGGAQSAPGLGLIDFNDATLESMDLSLRIRLAIKSCIDRFEPRLTNVRVQALNDTVNELTLKFYIVAEINSQAIHDRVQFSLLLDQNRQYRVF